MRTANLFRGKFTKSNIRLTYASRVMHAAYRGTDGIDRQSFEGNLSKNIGVINRKVLNGSYRFSPYLAKLISRGQHKLPRKVQKPTIRDKIVLRLVYEILFSIYNAEINERSLHSQIRRIILGIQNNDFDSIIRLDIKNYFPTIRHEALMQLLQRRIRTSALLNLISYSIQNPSDIDKKEGNTINNVGVPQGLSISNILANIYLFDFDKKYSTMDNIAYSRFVDDIAILCNSVDIMVIEASISNDLKVLGLELSADRDKHDIELISNGFQYLGYDFSNGKISVRRQSVHKLAKSIMSILTNKKHRENVSDSLLMFRINLRITGCIIDQKKYGWMFYFSQMNDKTLLYSLDSIVKGFLRKYKINSSQKKSFVKTWHEINRNFSSTTYIPNFDNFTTENKRSLLNSLGINASTDIEVEILFRQLIYKEVRELERDMSEIS